jgi:hypothetical protein
MAWLTTDAKPMVEGWGRPPDLSAPNIGTLVGEILRNKLARDKMTGESISGAIKNVMASRQSDAYLDAARAAGVLGEGDTSELGGIYGAKYGQTLADQIKDMNAEKSSAAYKDALAKHLTSGSGAADDEYPQTQYDEYGNLLYHNKSGWHRMPGQTTDYQKTVKESRDSAELARLIQHKADLDALSEAERQRNATANHPITIGRPNASRIYRLVLLVVVSNNRIRHNHKLMG